MPAVPVQSMEAAVSPQTGPMSPVVARMVQEWVPLELSFGIPLFNEKANEAVCERVCLHRVNAHSMNYSACSVCLSNRKYFALPKFSNKVFLFTVSRIVELYCQKVFGPKRCRHNDKSFAHGDCWKTLVAQSTSSLTYLKHSLQSERLAVWSGLTKNTVCMSVAVGVWSLQTGEPSEPDTS